MRTKLSVRAVRAENFQPLRPQLARRIIRPLLTATLGLAITFTLSCSSPDGGEGGSGGQSNPGPSVTYEGETYQTVVIGTQTWMAKNLNCNVEGSKCYNNDEANCDKYGRLYDWATAMVLPDCGYGTSCSSQIGANHRGICPSGWHIPSDDDWDILIATVGGKDIAGTKLKATSEWNSYGDVPLGTDEFGFAALLGGRVDGWSYGNFYAVGDVGSWWSATEGDARHAYGWHMLYNYEDVQRYDNDKTDLFSVRCLQD